MPAPSSQPKPSASSETSAPAQSSPSLLRSSAIVSVMTLLSRVLGLVRDVVVAHYFGARVDAFLVAFKIPNFFRRLFAEGAFSTAFVPVLSEYKTQRSVTEVKLLISRTSGMLGAALLLVTVLAVSFSDALPWLFAPGFRSDPEKFALTADLLKITFPYLLFIALTAFSGSVLNAYGRFAVPAFTPVLLNICLIIAALALTPYFDEPLFALAWGVFFAGLLQWVFQLPFLAREGRLVWPKLTPNDEGVKRILTLMGPALFGVSVSQINLLLDTLLASFLESGSVSWLYYSDRLNNLPLGIFAIAISVVILPSLSSSHAKQSHDAFSATLDWALRMVLLLALPAALALMVLATPLMSSIFFYGQMTAYDIGKMSLSLQAYSSGLLAFMMIKVLAPGYFARQDTKTPVRIGIWAMVVNMVLNLLLIVPLEHVGLALATALSSYFNAIMLYRGLRKDQAFTPSTGWWRFGAKLLFACGLMATSVGALAWYAGDWLVLPALHKMLWLALIVLVGLVVYAVALLAMGFRVKDFRAVQ